MNDAKRPVGRPPLGIGVLINGCIRMIRKDRDQARRLGINISAVCRAALRAEIEKTLRKETSK